MLKKKPYYAFLLPFFIFFIVFTIVPLIYAFYLSLHAQRMGTNVFIGFTNYQTMLGDSGFWHSVLRVVYYAILNISLQSLVSLGLALALDSPLVKFKTLLRTIYFLPYAIPAVVASIMWGFLYSPSLNPLLGFLGVGQHNGPLSASGLIYAVLNIVVWTATGYHMTIYHSALTDIPLEIYDAASIDGCGELRLAWSIKLPLIRPMISMTLVLMSIASLQLFTEPLVLSSITSVASNFTPNLDAYNNAFSFSNVTYSATLTMTVGVITIGATVIFLVIRRIANSLMK